MDNSVTKATAFVAKGRSIKCNRAEVTILIQDGDNKRRYELIGENGYLFEGTEVEMAAGDIARLMRTGYLVAEDPGLQRPAELAASLMPVG